MKAKTKTAKLDAWLLISVHNFDDIPVRLFHTSDAALRWLQKNPEFTPTNETLGTWEVTGHLGWKLLEFKNGKPNGTAETVRWNGEHEEPDEPPKLGPVW